MVKTVRFEIKGKTPISRTSIHGYNCYFNYLYITRNYLIVIIKAEVSNEVFALEKAECIFQLHLLNKEVMFRI